MWTATTTTISVTDEVFATLECGGRIIASVCKRNFSCVDDVVKFVYATCGQLAGLAKLSIRNKTQGWNMTLCLSRRRPAAHSTLPLPAATQASTPRQLSFNW